MAPRFNQNWHYHTRMMIAGERQPPQPGAPTSTPLYSSTTYFHQNLADFDAALAGTGYAYGRNGNPTNTALEIAAATAEAGVGALTTASGMSAIYSAILAVAHINQRPLRTVVAPRDMYGATTILLRDFVATYGTTIITCDMTNRDEVATIIHTHQPDLVYIEQLSNPLLRVVDVAHICASAKAIGARTVVDNTIATPIVQQPLTFGADFVCHSATKYFSGHGDSTGGVVVVANQEFMPALRHINATLGMVLGPYEALQILRGIKTMPLRVIRQCDNALAVATWLATHPAVSTVHYPGLPQHPDFATANDTLAGRYGAMVSFELANPKGLRSFVDTLQLVLPASTLGDIYTMLSVPAMASHRGLSVHERQARGISDTLIRLSVGIESVDDIINDLDSGLHQSRH
ncbi:MAG: trans-sulfuration enzyme family protein [Roseiflexaceae bacterium]